MTLVGPAVAPGVAGPAKAAGSGLWELISAQTVAADGDNLNWDSIPGTFTHLVLMLSLRADSADGVDDIGLQINDNTAGAYDGWTLLTSGSATFPNNYSAQNQITIGEVIGSADGNFAKAPHQSIVWIPDYTNSTFWTLCFGQSTIYNRGLTFGGALQAVGPVTELDVINITAGTGFKAGGVGQLYGIL